MQRRPAAMLSLVEYDVETERWAALWLALGAAVPAYFGALWLGRRK